MSKLVATTTEMLNSDLLRQIHMRAMLEYGKGICISLFKDPVKLKAQLAGIYDADRVQRNFNTFHGGSLKILAKAYQLHLTEDAKFRNIDEMFEAPTGDEREKNRPLLNSTFTGSPFVVQLGGLVGSAGAALFSYQAAAFATGVAVSTVGLAWGAFEQRVAALTILAWNVLFFERIFWFGTPTINQEVAAGVWIAMFRIASDVAAAVKKVLRLERGGRNWGVKLG
ncbi:hypothetical protein P154DRAFT_574917 [Amniculicola lignicola CBS 123094]|uniref:Uncharacterized protein n=1 Tax=Amniculicola lignicola CBS 123094 TaxID=1392246 RepID=A0A6A5WI48_9PLEO|nr:hypothetical protein P154DRAFT_574917 [Amniculicola lignicola CBS 123094]